MSTSTPGTSAGRRRPSGRTYNAEDQALNQISREAEARLAARRAERVQAREIRMRELEKKQKEDEQKQDREYNLSSVEKTTVVRSSSHRSDDSSHSMDDARELRTQLHEVEDKYKKAMVTTAQLDNEKQALNYQVDLLKDRLYEQQEALVEMTREFREKCRNSLWRYLNMLDHNEKQALNYQVDLLKDQLYEQQEALVEMTREFREKCRQYEQQRRDMQQLEHNHRLATEQLAQRDNLIQEQGLVIVGTETGELTLAKSPNHRGPVVQMGAALVTPEAAQILNSGGEGTLDEKLKLFSKDKKNLETELKRVREELEEERAKSQLSEKYSYPKVPAMNGPEIQISEIQHEASKQIHEYKLKLQKSDQDIATLEGSVGRLENQVKRFQAAAENAEKLEEELKVDKRKLQRELRESKNSIEELQNRNSHLQKRMEKLKQDRIAALVGQ